MNRQFERYLQMTLIILDLFVLNLLYFLCELILKVGIPVKYFVSLSAIPYTFKCYMDFTVLFFKNLC